MSYLATFNAADDPDFQKKCVVATWVAAQQIFAESPSTQNYDVRRGWAISVLQGTAKITPRQLAVQVLQNPVIAAAFPNVPDGDIQFQINSVIGSLVAIG